LTEDLFVKKYACEVDYPKESVRYGLFGDMDRYRVNILRILWRFALISWIY
jgi:hypothetical protein